MVISLNMSKEFLLDTNIIIKLWNDNPDVIDFLRSHSKCDFKVTNDTVMELANGEIENFFPKMGLELQALADRIINNPVSMDRSFRPSSYVVSEDNGLYLEKANKVSATDYGLINICLEDSCYVLVTEDKKMLKSSARLMDSNRFYNYMEFMKLLDNEYGYQEC